MAAIGGNQKKRKLLDGPEIEIDVSAPEPPSKKALRKAKKKAGDADAKDTDESKPAANINPENNAESATQKRSQYGIWIGNLAFSVTKDDLRRFFTTNCSFTDATITRINLPKPSDKNSRAQNKGFAYVDFSTPKALKEALELSEQLVAGRRVLIKDATSFQGRPEKSKEAGQDSTAAAASGRPPSKRVFVGNLSFDATKELLEEHFSKCGTVANVHLATFEDSGKCKGYAWVEFEDLEAAGIAVKGFKIVTEEPEEEEESESESGKQKKPLKPQRRKIWVNQIYGRRMRIEFAEDATTRYNKRFGKEGKKREAGNEEEPADFEEVTPEEKPQYSKPAKLRQAKPEYSRYDSSTVQKLSGAIIEGKGKKTTFD
ncbi:putative RNA binding protein Rnp24 [Aspergillus stella-maris]|uniref:putative RNA binding protein Rnp24 n=1 Tax=Aspergillus stella-maris TaxID=1810926 RepID=UPI003CCDFFD0